MSIAPSVEKLHAFKGMLVTLLAYSVPTFPGGPLVFEVGYHPRKKIHVIRVVFQDQAMYARTSFRGAKTCKIGK